MSESRKMDDPDSLTSITVTQSQVSCDGNTGLPEDRNLGHPNVYLNLGSRGVAYCPYCSRQFVLTEDAAEPAGH
ncbi:MAG: zinc-finger domain-containing protein [Rhodospirillales bacterium]|jgi:uncharacterized Zn-finger protein|nr:zinc-finger domain-containing protein [Rhodospirillales bacterium]